MLLISHLIIGYFTSYYDRVLLMFEPFTKLHLSTNLFSGGREAFYCTQLFIDYVKLWDSPAIVLVVVLVFMFTQLWKGVLSCLHSKICFLSLVAIFITNNTFNSAATQPLFMAHFLLALMLIWPLKNDVLSQPKEL